jgi:NTE family protein
MNKEKMGMVQTGFALSGGGARGFAHLGILEALSEKGIHPDMISGISAGAIVGAFLASGRSPRDIHEIMKAGNHFRYTRIQIPKTGFFRLDGLQKILEREIPFASIEELPLPLFIGVSNLTEGKMEYRNRGPLAKTVLASSSIPILFSPVVFDGCQYVDGGLLDNIGVEPLIGKCRKMVVSNISPLQQSPQINSITQMITRTFLVGIHARMREARNYADLYIEPAELTRFEVLKISKADEMFRIGYETVMRMEEAAFAPFRADS